MILGNIPVGTVFEGSFSKDGETKRYLCVDSLGERKVVSVVKSQLLNFPIDVSIVYNYQKIEKDVIFVKSKGSYWCDDLGNRWEKKYFTKERAERARKTLKDCKNCISCKRCVSCQYCENCEDCRGDT